MKATSVLYKLSLPLVVAAVLAIYVVPLMKQSLHHTVPAELARALATHPDSIVIYPDSHQRGEHRLALSGDAGQVLANCEVDLAGERLVVSNCEIASGASLEDVLAAVVQPPEDDRSEPPAGNTGVEQ